MVHATSFIIVASWIFLIFFFWSRKFLYRGSSPQPQQCIGCIGLFCKTFGSLFPLWVSWFCGNVPSWFLKWGGLNHFFHSYDSLFYFPSMSFGNGASLCFIYNNTSPFWLPHQVFRVHQTQSCPCSIEVVHLRSSVFPLSHLYFV
jgi:hypothetical protein